MHLALTEIAWTLVFHNAKATHVASGMRNAALIKTVLDIQRVNELSDNDMAEGGFCIGEVTELTMS